MITNQNYVGDPNPDVGEECCFLRCNFSQPTPDVDLTGIRLFPDAVDGHVYRFVECNLCNCEPPPGATVEGCLTVIKEFRLPAAIGAVRIDGHEIFVRHFVDRIHGRWTPDGYEYRDEPEDLDAGTEAD